MAQARTSENIKTENPFVNVDIFPNPVMDIININSDNFNPTDSNIDVYLFDATGQLKYQEKLKEHLSIPVNDFAPGMYLVQLINEAGETLQTEKIIKQ